MKKIVLLLFWGLCICACSTEKPDPPNTEGENDPEVQGKALSKFTQRTFYQSEVQETISFYYENNRPIVDSFFSKSNQLTYITQWEYDENGLVTHIRGRKPDNTIDHTSKIYYDELNRINRMEFINGEETYVIEKNFVFKDDSSIIATTATDGDESMKTYLLNSSGHIYKEEGDIHGEVEVIFEDGDVKTLLSDYATIHYAYDKTNMPKAPFLNYWSNIFGKYPNNVILWGNGIRSYSNYLRNKFVLTEDASKGGDWRYDRQFDSEGLLIKKTDYYNGTLLNEFDYIYD